MQLLIVVTLVRPQMVQRPHVLSTPMTKIALLHATMGTRALMGNSSALARQTEHGVAQWQLAVCPFIYVVHYGNGGS